MPSFGKTSRRRLKTCHPDIQRVFKRVVKEHDCSIICGRRGRNAQQLAFENGNSKVQWPDSAHNAEEPELSDAVDAGPYVSGKGIIWEPVACAYFAGKVMEIAKEEGVELRWGGDWDRDNDTTDQNFNDLVHFELVKK